MWKPLKLLPWVLTAGLAWTAGYAFNLYLGGRPTWLRAMYENKMVLATQVQASRRLLIVGGSGAHYTVNSQVLEQELGFPAINLGLDGNLGFQVIFPLIVEQVKPGDIVLLIPEYLLLLDEDGLGERTTEFEMGIRRPTLAKVPINVFAEDAFKLGIPTLRGLTKVGSDLVQKGRIEDYYSDALTDRGDPTKTWEREGDWWQLQIKKPISHYSVKAIQQFRKEVEARGGTLVLSLPVIYGSQDPKTLKNVNQTAEKLAQIAPLLYNKQSLNVLTDSSLFADTHYHLLPPARANRSRELARELRETPGSPLYSPGTPTSTP